MPYSLVSSATLGFDLVRLPAGRQVAGVLLTGLGADAGLLHRLAAVHPVVAGSPGQRSRWLARGRRVRGLAATGVPALRDTGTLTGPDTRAAALLQLLEQGTIGSAESVERLVRDDVLGPESAAAAQVPPDVVQLAGDLLADAAVAWWAGPALGAADLRGSTGLLDGLLDPQAPGPDLGPAADALTELLDRLRALDEPGRGRWRVAVDEVRGERRPWAAAMHGASWAAHVSGRTRSLAAAQLAGVQAFVDAGFPPADGARGVWNAVAGCVQALAVADLLDDGSLEVLSAPWVAVTGQGLPPLG